MQAQPSEVYHLEWETEPESEHEESSFAPSDHSADSHHYPHPQTVNIADELARCQGSIDPQFVEVLFYNRGIQKFNGNLIRLFSNEILLQRTQVSSNGYYKIFML